MLKALTKNDCCLFLGVTIFLNFDRVILGEYGFLRRLDVSDMYLNKMLFLANYWINPVEFGWDSSILRGWPAELGSIVPQYLGVLLAAVIPIKFVFPVLHILIDFLVLYGSFLFLKPDDFLKNTLCFLREF